MLAFRTIRGRLVAGFVTLLVLLTGALTLVAIDRAEAALVGQIEATHAARAETLGRDLDTLARGALDAARNVGRSSAFRDGLPDDALQDNGTVPADNATFVRTVLQQSVAAQPAFAAALLLTPDGAVRLGQPIGHQWDAVAQAETEAGRLAHEATARRAHELAPFVTTGLQPGSFQFVAPVRNAQNQYMGAVVFEGEPAALQAIGQRTLQPDLPGDEPRDANLYVLDANGVALTGPGGVRGNDVGSQVGGLDDNTGIVRLDGERHLVSLFALDVTPWSMMIATETSTAFAAVAGLVRTTVIVGAIGLALAVATSLVFAHDLTAPVRRLQAGAERVTAGEYGTQVRVSTRDEMSDLAGAFNAMSARLREDHERLLAHQETLEDQVRDRTAELAEKNEELEAFVYAASHDLRTPIISLDWLVSELEELFDTLQADAGDAEQAHSDIRATIQRLHANVDGMDRLLADLLELSRIGRTEGDPFPVDVEEVLTTVLDEHADAIKERHIEVELDMDGRPMVLADPRRIHQMLHNLVGNAIKYGADEDPKVMLRATPIGAATDPWKWRFEVMDNGPGVPMEQRERIFALFQRGLDPLGRQIAGTGVGLAMVRKIARAYGGDCQVAVAPGGGALFWFTLPAARTSHQRAAQELRVDSRNPDAVGDGGRVASRPLKPADADRTA